VLGNLLRFAHGFSYAAAAVVLITLPGDCVMPRGETIQLRFFPLPLSFPCALKTRMGRGNYFSIHYILLLVLLLLSSCVFVTRKGYGSPGKIIPRLLPSPKEGQIVEGLCKAKAEL
jgi:hypothetical protein